MSTEPSTTVELDAELAARLVTDQCPQWSRLPVTPVANGGWDNRTFHLGDDMLVRLPSADEYTAQVAKEQRWLPVLAPELSLPIPIPLAHGRPTAYFPRPWSVYNWLDGEIADVAAVHDLARFATDLGEFLVTLRNADATGGPAAGDHSFGRGGPVSAYDSETREALDVLGSSIDADAARQVWDRACASEWDGPLVWFHGDVSARNLLVVDGRLHAVIDFGTSGVGDPACDLYIAWTYLDESSRAAFRAAVGLDDETWARGRGWTLWKALIVAARLPGTDPTEAERSRRVIDVVLADHRADRRSA